MGQRIERNAFPPLITHDHLAGLIWSRSLNGWPAGGAGPCGLALVTGGGPAARF
jgi:hypothetical protein